MKRICVDLFSERGNISMMRVMSLLSLLIGGYLALKGQDTSVIIFVSAAFGGKIWQKRIEKSPGAVASESAKPL